MKAIQVKMFALKYILIDIIIENVFKYITRKRAKKMIKVTFGLIRSENFNKSIKILGSSTEIKSIKTAYKIKKILARIAVEQKTSNEIWDEKIKQFILSDKDGNPIMASENQVKLNPELLGEFQEMEKEFLNTEIEIDCEKINLDELEGVKISPIELMAIESFLDE